MKDRIPLVIDNEKYFAMIDNQVRKLFAKFEADQCLQWAEWVWNEAGKPDLKEFPIEGYYYKSDALKRYFTLIRNFQQNEEVYKKVKESPWLENLRRVLHTEIFGTEVPAGEYYPWPDAPLKRRWDLLTYTMSDKSIFNEYAVHPWDIPSVMSAVKKKARGLRNLPELAALIGSPELVCASCETNSLGRMYACLTGSLCCPPPPPRFIWQVSPEVEELGRAICALYNEVTTPFAVQYWGNTYTILAPTIELCQLSDMGRLSPAMDWTVEYPRVCHLGYVIIPDLNYFWILDNNGNLTDLYQKEMLTTEQYRKQTMGPEHNWFNGKVA